MNFTDYKTIFYMLIIATFIDFTLSWPIMNNKNDLRVQVPENLVLIQTRFTRQVVQPTWLNFDREPPIDPTVHVNQQALSEAEEIRKTIQKAVKDDTYAVTDEQQRPNNAMGPLITMPPSRETKQTQHRLPNWFIQTQKLWQNWTHNLFKNFRN